MKTIGFDTSNYTTSIAYFDEKAATNCSKLLPVRPGELGLRQSDAVFQHIKSLPELSDRLFSNLDLSDVTAIGVSTQPRAVEGSYMPCFMVGYAQASLLADALHVPLVTCSHQQGHVAAAAWSAGRMDLLDTPHLAWHLSGGTTELLLIQPSKGNVVCSRIGGTTDISAGQLIDRTGQLLKLPFPSGKHIDDMSSSATRKDLFRVKCEGMYFSLSGVQNKVQQFYKEINSASETAAYVLRCICTAIQIATEHAKREYPGLPVLFSGGVSSNSLLRSEMMRFDPVFAQPQYSTDNALGVAIIAHRSQRSDYGTTSSVYYTSK